MSRYSHDCTTTIRSQYKICGPYRDLFSCKRMNYHNTKVITFFTFFCSFDLCHVCDRCDLFNDVNIQKIIFHQIFRNRMFCCQSRVSHSVNGIRARSKYGIFVKFSSKFFLTCRAQFKIKFKSLRFPYPVTLHRNNLIWPLSFK